MRWLASITDLMDTNVNKLWEIVGDTGAWRASVHRVTEKRTQLSDWTTLTELASDLIPTSPTGPSKVSEKPGDGPDQLHKARS